MKIKYGIILILVSSLFFVQCEDLLNLAEETEDLTPSTEEVVEGLKKALVIGTDSSTTALNKLNAYYGNPLLKIPLPEEAEGVRNVINKYTSTLQSVPVLNDFLDLDAQFEKVIQAVNYAAEDAAKDAGPIFKDAISDLSISEGWDILNGIVPGETSGTKSAYSGDFDSTAATQFLKIETYNPLVALYAPKINTALDKKVVLEVSANDAWNTLTTSYNNLRSNFLVKNALSIASIDKEFPLSLNADLGEFSTQKALDGLFYVVGQEEKKIRKNPFEWAVDIIKKVFGYIFEE